MAEEKTLMEMAETPNGLSELIFGKSLKTPTVEKKEEPKVEAKAEETKEEVKDENIVETALGKIKVENTEDKYKTFIEKTGVTIKSDDDIISYINRAKEAEERESELIKSKKLGDDFKVFFETAPEDIKQMLIAYANNQDYRSVGKTVFGNSIDYNKSWSEYDDKDKLIKKYGDLTDDELDDMDEKSRNIIEKSAKNAYELERNNVIAGNKKFLDNQTKLAENINQSIRKSIQKLQERFPEMSKSRIKEIEKKMYSQPFNDMFNEDRTYKEEAAIKIAMANYGVETIDSIQNTITAKLQADNDKIIKQRVSEELELIAKGRNDTVKGGGSDSGSKTAQEKIVESTRWMQNSSSGFRNKNQG